MFKRFFPFHIGAIGPLDQSLQQQLYRNLPKKFGMDPRAFPGISAEQGSIAGNRTPIRIHERDFAPSPWGIARLAGPLKSDAIMGHAYNNPRGDLGLHVNMFIVDTIIATAHDQFKNRAQFGGRFGEDLGYNIDHGTHVAGTAAGTVCGIAPNANITSIVVADDRGKFSILELIRGLKWTKELVATRYPGQPNIINISLVYPIGSIYDKDLDEILFSLSKAGVHIVVSAGNDDDLAQLYMPARLPYVITVGASTIYDRRAPFSNHGPEVNIFAPGKDIVSLEKRDPKYFKILSGTSMAAAHVTGLVACLIRRYGNMPPEAMMMLLDDLSAKDVVSDIPPGTCNRLAQLGFNFRGL